MQNVHDLLFAHLYHTVSPSTPNVTVTATSPRSIAVTWSEVTPTQNITITMYEVRCQPLQTFDGTIGTLTMNVTERSITLRNLEEFTNYNISVRAYTSEGEGTYSTDITEQTWEDSKFKIGIAFYHVHIH